MTIRVLWKGLKCKFSLIFCHPHLQSESQLVEFFLPKVSHRNLNFSSPKQATKSRNVTISLFLSFMSEVQAPCPGVITATRRAQEESVQPDLFRVPHSVYHHQITLLGPITFLHESLSFIEAEHKNNFP